MKRLLSVLFALLLLIGCVACGEDEDALVRVTYLGGEQESVRLSQVQQNQIFEILAAQEEKIWSEDLTNCGYDYEIKTQTQAFLYTPSCGILTNPNSGCCVVLSQEQSDALHDILGIPHEEVSTYFP